MNFYEAAVLPFWITVIGVVGLIGVILWAIAEYRRHKKTCKCQETVERETAENNATRELDQFLRERPAPWTPAELRRLAYLQERAGIRTPERRDDPSW